MHKLGIIGFIVALCAIAASLFYIFHRTGGKDIGISVSMPDEMYAGVPADIAVQFENLSGSVLNNVSLEASLPDGVVFAGSSEEKRVDNRNIGNLGVGGVRTETYKVIALKGKDSAQQLSFLLNYTPESLGKASRFGASKSAEMKVKDAGFGLQFKAPEKVFSGEDFDVEVAYKNNTPVDLNGLKLAMEYPASFEYGRATIKPDQGNAVWLLGDLHKGSEGSLSIHGSAAGPDNAPLSFRAIPSVTVDGREYALEPVQYDLSIAPSPLSLTIRLNDADEYIGKPGDQLTYILSYSNNTDAPLREVVIRARLAGALFDFNTLAGNAIADLNNATLVWNSRNAPELAYINPHSAGSVQFSVKLKDAYPVRRFSDKNFIVKVNGEIESPTVSPGTDASRTYSIAKLETKVAGTMALQAKAYFRDANAGVLNAGSVPFRVGQKTQMTVHWVLRNFAADVSNVEVLANLPEGVKFAGQAKSNFSTVPAYDYGPNKVVWTIP